METGHRVLPRGKGDAAARPVCTSGVRSRIYASGREKDRRPLRPRTGKGRRERSGSPGLPGAGASRRGAAAAQLPPGAAAGRPADRRPPGPGPRARAPPPPASRSRCASQRDEPGWHDRLAVPGIDQARRDPGARSSCAAGGRGEGGAEGARSQPAGTGREATRCCDAPRAVGGGQETGGTSQFGRGGGHPIPGKTPGAAGGSCPQGGKRRKDSSPWRKRQTPPRKTPLVGSRGPSEAGLPRRAVSSSPSPRCTGMSGRGHCGGPAFGRAPPFAQARSRFRRETARRHACAAGSGCQRGSAAPGE